LGYLFDRSSGTPSGVAFDQSVSLVMQKRCRGCWAIALFNVNGLQQVYQRRANNYSFNTGELKV